MKNPFVSVIIPNYNHARYLNERIDSVLNQSYHNFEIIILDDVSTDDSKEIIEQYRGNEHVSQIIFNTENSGSTFKQWHKGFEHAKGELIWIAESDDSCETTLLDSLVAEFNHDDKLALAFCASMIIDENGERKYLVHTWTQQRIHLEGCQFITEHLSYDNYVFNASSALFRKDVAMNIDTQYAKFKGSGDWLFWIEICEKGNVAFVNKPLNLFRKHNTNLTQKFESNGIQQIENRKIYDYLYHKGHIKGKQAKKLKKDHLYFYRYCVDFISPGIKKKVLKTWNDSFRLECEMFVRRILHNMKLLLSKSNVNK